MSTRLLYTALTKRALAIFDPEVMALQTGSLGALGGLGAGWLANKLRSKENQKAKLKKDLAIGAITGGGLGAGAGFLGGSAARNIVATPLLAEPSLDAILKNLSTADRIKMQMRNTADSAPTFLMQRYPELLGQAMSAYRLSPFRSLSENMAGFESAVSSPATQVLNELRDRR